MRYLHVLSAFAAEPWALQPEKLQAILAFLAFKAEGGMYSADEVKARIAETRARETAAAPGGVAVIPVYGVISQRAPMMGDISSGGGASTEQIGAAFRQAMQDEAIKAIVLDGDTPGGGTYGVDELASEIRSARGVKPIVAQVNSLTASAGYYILSQADEVVVTPSGEAGSIGVYGVHEDISEMLAKAGVRPTLVRGEKGTYKAETIDFQPLSRDALSYMQERVNRAEAMFIKAVAEGRRTTQTNVVDNFGKGRMFGAADLVRRGMADRVGTLNETLQRLGADSPRFTAAAESRKAFARGENPGLSQIEDVLREAGFPNALATAFVSAGKGVLRSESGPAETATLSPDAKASLAALMAKLSG